MDFLFENLPSGNPASVALSYIIQIRTFPVLSALAGSRKNVASWFSRTTSLRNNSEVQVAESQSVEKILKM
jgi:hypothetical protein